MGSFSEKLGNKHHFRSRGITPYNFRRRLPFDLPGALTHRRLRNSFGIELIHAPDSNAHSIKKMSDPVVIRIGKLIDEGVKEIMFWIIPTIFCLICGGPGSRCRRRVKRCLPKGNGIDHYTSSNFSKRKSPLDGL